MPRIFEPHHRLVIRASIAHELDALAGIAWGSCLAVSAADNLKVVRVHKMDARRAMGSVVDVIFHHESAGKKSPGRALSSRGDLATGAARMPGAPAGEVVVDGIKRLSGDVQGGHQDQAGSCQAGSPSVSPVYRSGGR